MRSMGSNTKENIPDEPDLSIEKAKGDFALFVPGISASLLLYIVFGTTQHFRQYTAKLLVPRCIRERFARNKEQPGPYTGPPPVPLKDYPYGNQYETQPPGPPRRPSVPNSNHMDNHNHSKSFSKYTSNLHTTTSDDDLSDDLEKKAGVKTQERRVQIRQHPRNNSQHTNKLSLNDREEEPIDLSRSTRPSLSWYGSRPSDIERGHSEFSPIDGHNHHGTIPLQYIEPQRLVAAPAVGGGSGDDIPMAIPKPLVTANMSKTRSGSITGSRTTHYHHREREQQDDEWPILIQNPTPLSPRPRSRSGDRQ